MLKTNFLTIIPRRLTPTGIVNTKILSEYPSIWDAFDRVFDSWPGFNESFETVLGSDGILDPWTVKDHQYTVEFELPRFRKESIKLTIEGGWLHCAAEQDNLKFYKSVRLPANYSDVSSKLDHGILTVTVGCIAPPKPFEVTIDDAPTIVTHKVEKALDKPENL